MSSQFFVTHFHSFKNSCLLDRRMINPFVLTLNFVRSSISMFSGSGDIPTQNDIYILTQRNFRQALSQHELLMVKFYLPWCSTCKSFAPEYVKLSNLLRARKSQVKLGQVNGDVEINLTKEYGVVGFPALRLFKQGRPINYYGSKQANDIVVWLNNYCPEH